MDNIFSRVLIKDEQNHMLVIQDREEEWNLPGGKLEKGEIPIECAIREVKEEIGLEVIQLSKFFQGEFLFGDIKWRGYFYFAEVVKGRPVINELDKIKDIRFVSNIDDVKFAPQLSEVIEFIGDQPFQWKITSWNE